EAAGYSYGSSDVTTAVNQIRGGGHFVYVIMNAQNPGFPFIQQVMNQLGSGYVPVSAQQYTNLYMQSQGITTTSSSHSTTSTTSSSTTSTHSSTSSSSSTSHTSTSSSTSHSTTHTSSSTSSTTSTTKTTSTDSSTSATSSSSSSVTSSTSPTTSSYSTSSDSSTITSSVSTETLPTSTSQTSDSSTTSLTTETSSITSTDPSTTTSDTSSATSTATSTWTSETSSSQTTQTTLSSSSTTSTDNDRRHPCQYQDRMWGMDLIHAARYDHCDGNGRGEGVSLPSHPVTGAQPPSVPRSGFEFFSATMFAPSPHQPVALALGVLAAFGVFFTARLPVKALLNRRERSNKESSGWRW
ncbi:MAG: hypothetical protein OK457_05125, partial [Thaumarchaeota archaeon]|nr:hypothetical protein [Nitrososphaerota archaeon]